MLRFPSRPAWLGIGGQAVGSVAPGLAGLRDSVPLAPAQERAPALLAAVEQWLAGPGAPRRLLQAVVSDRYLRYVYLPWQDDVLSAQEDAILCRARLAALYGGMEGWQLQLAPRRYGRGRLACAMPDWLLDGLRQAAARRGARLGAVLPQFAVCWNQDRRRFARGPVMLAVADGDHLALGTCGPAGWLGWRAQFIAPHAGALEDAARREKLRLALPSDLPLWHAGFAAGMAQQVAHG